MVKYASNNFHAMKVAFANEIGAVCQQLGIDGQQVMRVFCEDRELNISPRYLRPGFGFGGSCLPKDLRAMVLRGQGARRRDAAARQRARQQRRAHPAGGRRGARAAASARVAMLGLSFKVGSDDLRESPFVRLAEALIGKGVPLRICDPDVALGDVFGRNRAYIDEHLPHVGAARGATTSTRRRARRRTWSSSASGCRKSRRLARLRPRGQTVIDLVGIPESGRRVRPWAATRRVRATRQARHARRSDRRRPIGRRADGLRVTYISWAESCSRSDHTARELGGRSHMVYLPQFGSRPSTILLQVPRCSGARPRAFCARSGPTSCS